MIDMRGSAIGPQRPGKRTRRASSRLGVERLEERQLLATFTVTNTSDNIFIGSFRRAITDANNTGGLDTIEFKISSGAQSITPTGPLPTITDAVIIDGTTQPGTSGPAIELNGSQAGGVGLR